MRCSFSKMAYEFSNANGSKGRQRERERERERDRVERDWERLNENSKRNRGRRMIQNVNKVCMRMKILTVHLGKY